VTRKGIVYLTIFGIFVTIPAKAQNDFPRVELFGGFSLLHPSVPGNLGKGTSQSQFIQSTGESVLGNVPGWGASATVNFSRMFGVTADFGGNYKNADMIQGVTVNASGNLHTFLFGPTVTMRNKRVSPFAHALFGVGRVSASAEGSRFTYSETGFAASIGGGVDIALHRHIALRAVEADYFPYRHADGNASMFNNIRWRSGIVIH
jgi:Outer membrane protein beta-barrel domain